jgi:DNA repair exonuclease SbcCD nuclease subunit
MQVSKMNNDRIMILGDTHGVWHPVNKLINRRKPNMILQCGDFGYFPKLHQNTELNMEGCVRRKPWDQFGLKNTKPFYWCDGNHDDHDSLKVLIDKREPFLMPNFSDVYHCPRGSYLTLPDGRVVLFIGGGHSIDFEYRTQGLDWWKTEVIDQDDVDALPDIDVDIIISHTCPRYFFGGMKMEMYLGKHTDPSCVALNIAFDKYRPKLWYFGHFHHRRRGTYKYCKWTALANTHMEGWWDWLPE